MRISLIILPLIMTMLAISSICLGITQEEPRENSSTDVKIKSEGNSVIGIPEPASQFSVNPTRFDPYKNFKFRVKWDGRYVAGVSKISPLIRTTEIIERPDETDPNKINKAPGSTSYKSIVLYRGVTHDPEFEAWANKVWDFSLGNTTEEDFRKDITIELYNEAGQLAIAYKVYDCWVSEFQALPELDANGNAIAIQTITLENGGWERDSAVPEPSEPSFAEPST
ncbi:MAG: phage tail protein [Methanotrichaceae archaeon]|nr:phage tail protein [Methanotrichaceae archaeon]